MKTLLLLMAMATLIVAGPAQAQCNPDPNEIGIFWEPDCGNCLNCIDFIGGELTAYVVLINASQPGGVHGFEFSLTNADGSTFMPPPMDFVISYNLPPGGINVDTAPDFIVGIATPLPWSPCITLISISMLVFAPESWCFGVRPISFPSIPGHMAYADGADPGNLLPMYPNTGPDAPDYMMACLNSFDCPTGPVATENSSWGTLKSLYR